MTDMFKGPDSPDEIAQRKLGEKLAVWIVAGWMLFCATMVLLLGYVAVHFLIKFW